MKILITSGGTSEAIDSVRHITNKSTGRLGKVIAETFLAAGHQVTLVTTDLAVKPEKHPALQVHLIRSVADLEATLEPLVKTHEVLIHAMAVSDYTPLVMADLDTVMERQDIRSFLNQSNHETKISSQADYQVLFLKKTPKIIRQVKWWNPQIVLIGFKLLVDVTEEELIRVARKSLLDNQADYILANDLTKIDQEQHQAHLVSQQEVIPLQSKQAIAQKLLAITSKGD